ncbi:MAG TPA: ABC transporter permease [Candidatus Hydrogenedentes bacterium]|nr:ABC transporter permease [Candidatus Hydrogenedentota bacterium]
MSAMPKPDAGSERRAHAKQSYARLVARQFRKRRMSVVALVFLILLGVIGLLAPFLAGGIPIYMKKDGKQYWFPNLFKYDELVRFDYSAWKPAPGDASIWPIIPYAPEKSDLRNRLQPPTRAHLLGTDDRGRDVLSRIIWGTRISMSVGFVAEGIAVLIGVFFGALAGFYMGKTDMIVMRAIEIVTLFPVFVLIITLISLLPPSIWNIMVVLGITSWTGTARLVRGEMLKLRNVEFALAARASGFSDSRIIFRHLLPNALSPVLVSATFGVAGAILIESALSFLGFGVPPPTASWGEVLSQSKTYLTRGAWWLVVFPGVAIFLTVTAFNLVGAGLRDAMDPRLRE